MKDSDTYVPKINDYVIWNHHGIIHEGWVYFVASETEHKRGWRPPTRYISIEIARKEFCYIRFLFFFKSA